MNSEIMIVCSDDKQADLYKGFLKKLKHVNMKILSRASDIFQDLCVSDYEAIIIDHTPMDDLIDIVSKVKKISPDMFLVAISESVSAEDVVRVMKAGASEYFPKPIKAEALSSALARGLENRRNSTNSWDSQLKGYVNLINCCQLISGTLEERKICELALGYLRKETGSKGAALYKMQSDRWDRMTTALDLSTDVMDVTVEWSKILLKCQQEKAMVKIVPKSVVGPELLVFSFRCVSDVNFFAVVAEPTLNRDLDELTSMLKLLQAQILLVARNIQHYKGVKTLLFQDDVTGLNNARYLSVVLDQMLATSDEKKPEFAIYFLDVDHFKKVNDTYGHLVGTHLLKEMGTQMQAELRTSDIICRYGGDEFVVILKDVDRQQALMIAERIRKRIEDHEFVIDAGKKIKMTISIGVALCPEHASTKVEILSAADTAMYEVKKNSKNAVYVYAPGQGISKRQA